VREPCANELAGENAPSRKWANRYITEEVAQDVISALRDTEGWPADDVKDLAMVCRLANQFHSSDVLIWAANNLAASGGCDDAGKVYGGNLKAAYQSYCQRTFREGVPTNGLASDPMPDSKRMAPSVAEMQAFYGIKLGPEAKP
jgi:hypothetical protein